MANDYSEIKSCVDIVDYIGRYADLECRCGEYRCNCLFHKESTPSMYVNKDKQVFVCRGCGVGGDLLTFIQEYHHVTFDEAVNILSIESGRLVHRRPKILSEVRRFKPKIAESTSHVYLFDNCMDEFPQNHHIEEWISEGISEEVLEKYDVRYSNDKTKILFPIKDGAGRIVSVKCRNLSVSKSKYVYLNKLGCKDFLYNFDYAKQSIIDKSECIVVEGEKSVLKLETWGIHNSVAVGSHCLNKDEFDILIRTSFSDVVFAYDSDVDVKEIQKQAERLRHYKKIYYIPTGSLQEKSAPCDFGIDVWNDLYEKRERIT